ncbi:MAG: polysaccharide deacetylase family protein [Clostridiales bacterium]|nr:polysaccharide deacetylase family protein [Clostridiales bacterium]
MKKLIIILCLLLLVLIAGCTVKEENPTIDESDLSTTIDAQPEPVNSPKGKKVNETVEYSVIDPENKRGLSTEKISHSYGVAKDGKPNQISVDFQNMFDEKGWNAVCYDNKSNDKRLYLTFDCGYENGNTEKILDVLKDKKVPAAFFCTLYEVKENKELIKRMIDEGHIVGNHSNTHPSFAEISRTQMMEEIKAMDDYLRTEFNYSSAFFRFPKGEYSENAIDLVNSLGFKCVFWSCSYADWDVNKQKGSKYAFDTVTSRLHPGAVILLHSVSSDNAAALGEIIDTAREKGYEFKSLNDLP